MSEEIKDSKMIRKCPLCGREYLKPKDMCDKCNLVLVKLSDYDKLKLDPVRFNQITKEREERKQANVPKCPICGSTNLSKITITHKAGKIALFGIFGMGDNGKTWKCNNCGSKF